MIIALLHVVCIGCHKGYEIMQTAATQMADTLHVYMHCHVCVQCVGARVHMCMYACHVQCVHV